MFLILVGPSMKPTMGLINFCWGRTNPAFVGVGDVVGFRRGRDTDLIVHRVVDINRFGVLFIKGDNSSAIDTAQFKDVVLKVDGFRKVF